MAEYQHTSIHDNLRHIDARSDLHQWWRVGSSADHFQQREQSTPVIASMDACCVCLQQVVQAVRHMTANGMYDFGLNH